MTMAIHRCVDINEVEFLGLKDEHKEALSVAMAVTGRNSDPEKADQIALSIYGVTARVYEHCMGSIANLSELGKSLDVKIQKIEVKILRVPEEYEKACQLGEELRSQLVETDQNLSVLRESAQKAKAVWLASQEALAAQNPGKKPNEKKAIQDWKKKVDVFNKIAPRLRQKEKENKSAWERAERMLYEANCKKESLQAQLSQIALKQVDPGQQARDLESQLSQLKLEKARVEQGVQQVISYASVCNTSREKEMKFKEALQASFKSGSLF